MLHILAEQSTQHISPAVSGPFSSGSSTLSLGASARAAMSFLQTLKPSSTVSSTSLPSQSLVPFSSSATATSTQLRSASTSAIMTNRLTQTRRPVSDLQLHATLITIITTMVLRMAILKTMLIQQSMAPTPLAVPQSALAFTTIHLLFEHRDLLASAMIPPHNMLYPPVPTS